MLRCTSGPSGRTWSVRWCVSGYSGTPLVPEHEPEMVTVPEMVTQGRRPRIGVAAEYRRQGMAGVPSLPVDVHADYVALIRAAVVGAGGIAAFAKEAGISRQAMWRVLSGGGDRDRPSVEVIEKIRNALLARGVWIPPVCVAVRDEKHYQWIEVGEALRERDPERFDRLLAELAGPPTGSVKKRKPR